MKKTFSRNIFLAAFALLLVAVLPGCIKDDIPYPRIQPNITELVVEGQSQAAHIDTLNRVATVYLSEAVDIENVRVLSCKLSHDAHFVGDSIAGTIDLSSSRFYTVELYQQYVWTLAARQTIERYITASNQIGASVIDVPGQRVVMTFPEGTDLSAIRILTAKLGSVNSTLSPELQGNVVDLSRPLEVDVTDYGRTEVWTLYAETTEVSVTTLRADAWTCVAWVYGEAQEGKDNTIEYRRADSDQWIRVPSEWLTVDGGNFHARLIHLEPLTEYVARAVSGDEYGAELSFTTGTTLQLPNSDFENWWLDGKVWCPWAEDGTPFWGTGNKGTTTLGSSNTVPTDDTPTGTGKAAHLETRFVGISILGKLAAGNIFAGTYVRTDGTDGVLSFGREYTQRPTKLRGYYKYHSATISHASSGFSDLKGRPDTCIIWCALIDSAEPFEIRTKPSNRQLFDENGAEVVAYGKMEVGHDVAQWQEFEFELNYRATDRVPRYILVVASASKLGDYFTGGNGSILDIDDFELLYDY